MNIDLFNFTLPEDKIALHPITPRFMAKMLHVHKNGHLTDRHVKDLWNILQPNDCLVFNNSKVIKAFLQGRVITAGRSAKFEMNLLKPVTETQTHIRWETLVRGAGRLRIGDQLFFQKEDAEIHATLTHKTEQGHAIIEFPYPAEIFWDKIDKVGQMPLPPYIAKMRCVNPKDEQDYQSVFAEQSGSVAAPTASLHFDRWMMEQLEQSGIPFHFVTLHVGAGTFLPVKTENISEHQMHSEYGYISPQTATYLNKHKQVGGRIIAVGTTALRVLESATTPDRIIHPFAQETDIFITPPYKFRCADGLITNFHFPQSTLFMLVCAFSGIETMQNAYRYAIEHNYRFFSYGDACYLERASF